MRLMKLILAVGLTMLAMGAAGETVNPDTWSPTTAQYGRELYSTDILRVGEGLVIAKSDALTTPAAGWVGLRVDDTTGTLRIVSEKGTEAVLGALPATVVYSDVATSFTAGQEMPSLHVTGWMALGSPGTPVETRYRRVVTVSARAADNPTRTTIQGAIDWINWAADQIPAEAPSAAERWCILLQPGTYAEMVELPDYVDLIGVSRSACIISMTSTRYVNDARQSALVCAKRNSTVANVTINNTKTDYPSTAINLGWGWSGGASGCTIKLLNCSIIGGAEDVLYTTGVNDILIDGCSIACSGTKGDTWSMVLDSGATHVMRNSTVLSGGGVSPGTPPIWMTGSGKALVEGCRITTKNASYGIVRFASSGNGQGGLIRFSHCELRNEDDSLAVPLHSVVSGTGWDIELNRSVFSSIERTNANATIAYDVFGGPVDAKSLSIGGTERISSTGVGALTGAGIDGALTVNESSADVDWRFEGNGDVNLFYGDAGNDRVGIGTATPGVKLDVAGPANATGLTCTATQWRYFDAVACSAGWIDPLIASSLLLGTPKWTPDAATNAAYLVVDADGDGATVYFPVTYEAGTILTRISVRWQGIDASDGIIFTLQKRQGGTTSAAWATVETATYSSASETNSVLDVDPDETLAVGYSYRVMVEANIATVGARVWEVGVETSKRAY